MLNFFKNLLPNTALKSTQHPQAPITESVPVSPQLQGTSVDSRSLTNGSQDQGDSTTTTQNHASPLPINSQIRRPSFFDASDLQRPTTPEHDKTDLPNQDTTHLTQNTSTQDPQVVDTIHISQDPQVADTNDISQNPQVADTIHIRQGSQVADTIHIRQGSQVADTIHISQDPQVTDTNDISQDPQVTDTNHRGQQPAQAQQEPTLPVLSEKNLETSMEYATVHLQRNLSHYFLLQLAKIIVPNFNAPLQSVTQDTFLNNWTHLDRTETEEPYSVQACIITFLQHFNNIDRMPHEMKKSLRYVHSASSLVIEASLFKDKLDQLKEEIQQQPEHIQALLQHIDNYLDQTLLQHTSINQSTLEKYIADILLFLEQDANFSIRAGCLAIEKSYITDAETTYIEMEKREQSGTPPSAKSMIDSLKLSYLKHHSALAFLTQCQMQTRQYMNTCHQYLVQALDGMGHPSSAANPSEMVRTIQSQSHALETKTNDVRLQLTSTLNTLTHHYKTLEEKGQYSSHSPAPKSSTLLYIQIAQRHNAHSYKEFKSLIDLLHHNFNLHNQENMLHDAAEPKLLMVSKKEQLYTHEQSVGQQETRQVAPELTQTPATQPQELIQTPLLASENTDSQPQTPAIKPQETQTPATEPQELTQTPLLASVENTDSQPQTPATEPQETLTPSHDSSRELITPQETIKVAPELIKTPRPLFPSADHTNDQPQLDTVASGNTTKQPLKPSPSTEQFIEALLKIDQNSDNNTDSPRSLIEQYTQEMKMLFDSSLSSLSSEDQETVSNVLKSQKHYSPILRSRAQLIHIVQNRTSPTAQLRDMMQWLSQCWTEEVQFLTSLLSLYSIFFRNMQKESHGLSQQEARLKLEESKEILFKLVCIHTQQFAEHLEQLNTASVNLVDILSEKCANDAQKKVLWDNIIASNRENIFGYSIKTMSGNMVTLHHFSQEALMKPSLTSFSQDLLPKLKRQPQDAESVHQTLSNYAVSSSTLLMRQISLIFSKGLWDYLKRTLTKPQDKDQDKHIFEFTQSSYELNLACKRKALLKHTEFFTMLQEEMDEKNTSTADTPTVPFRKITTGSFVKDTEAATTLTMDPLVTSTTTPQGLKKSENVLQCCQFLEELSGHHTLFTQHFPESKKKDLPALMRMQQLCTQYLAEDALTTETLPKFKTDLQETLCKVITEDLGEVALASQPVHYPCCVLKMLSHIFSACNNHNVINKMQVTKIQTNLQQAKRQLMKTIVNKEIEQYKMLMHQLDSLNLLAQNPVPQGTDDPRSHLNLHKAWKLLFSQDQRTSLDAILQFHNENTDSATDLDLHHFERFFPTADDSYLDNRKVSVTPKDAIVRIQQFNARDFAINATYHLKSIKTIISEHISALEKISRSLSLEKKAGTKIKIDESPEHYQRLIEYPANKKGILSNHIQNLYRLIQENCITAFCAPYIRKRDALLQEKKQQLEASLYSTKKHAVLVPLTDEEDEETQSTMQQILQYTSPPMLQQHCIAVEAISDSLLHLLKELFNLDVNDVDDDLSEPYAGPYKSFVANGLMTKVEKSPDLFTDPLVTSVFTFLSGIKSPTAMPVVQRKVIK